jgi:PKD repeat protein
LSVTPGEVLAVNVGGTTSTNTGGWNGGGNGTSNGAGGGGGSDIRSGGTALVNRVVTAGGGGGGGWNCGSGMNGGHGGGSANAQDGFNCGSNSFGSCVVGGGATPTAGGQQPGCGCGNAGVAGIGGQGGTCGQSGGGGGGGQFGGGGGYYGGGGGGSSFASPTRTSSTTHTQGFRSGNGQIVISYNVTLICASPRVPAVIWLDSLPAPVASGDTAFCGSGSASLSVTGPNGNYSWYDNWGGNLMHIGQNWTTPSLNQTINFHVNYKVNGCPSKFDTALVQVTPIPVALLSDPGTVCVGNGLVDLGFDPPLLQDSLTFTNCGATGQFGPDQAAANTAYGPGLVTVNQGIQNWVVPYTATYRIVAAGAQGGTGAGLSGGNGALMEGDFFLTAGTTLKILVGQQPDARNCGGANCAGAGGGGTFVATANNTPLIVAGGGGGAGSSQAGLPGVFGVDGTSSGGSSGFGGLNGGGGGGALSGAAGTQNTPGGVGNSCSYGSGGGGFYTAGGRNCNGGSPFLEGQSFLSGGAGGNPDLNYQGPAGGFGGGAGVGHRAAGGGGWSGGAGDGQSNGGGGGGSFNAGTNQLNASGANTGMGYVSISYGIPQPSDTNGVWSGVTITDTLLGTFNPQLGVLGNNTVVYTVNNNGCTFTDSLIINVVQGPDASITTAATQLCDYDNSISLAALNSGGNWSGNGVSSVGNNVSFDPGSVTAGTYQAYHSIFDAATGCLSTDSVQIVVNPTPNASVTAPSVICSADAPFNLQPGTTGGVFTGAGVTDTLTGLFTPNTNLVGNTMVYYSVTANGCVNSDSAQLSIFVSPNANISNAPQQLCANSSNILLQAATVGGNWYGNGMANSNSGLFDVQLAGTGTAQVIYMVSNANCTNSDTVSIVVNPMPVVTVAPNSIQNICSGSSIPMNASGAVTYQWTNGGSPISGANTPSYTAGANGSYSVVGTDANGCVTVSAPVTVNVLPNPVLYQMTAAAVCEGNQTSFSQNSGIGQGGVITSYNWNFGDGNTGTGFTTNHVYATAGTYQATLIVATPEGCSDTLSQLVQVNANPVVDSVQNVNVCFPAPAAFTAFVSGTNVANYNWNFGNGSTGNGQSVSHNFSAPGTYYYNLVTTGVNGCVSNFAGTVAIERTPVAGFLSSNGCTDQPLNFYNNSTGSVVNYNWNFGNGTSNVANPTNVFTQPGTYPVSLTVSTGQGCADSHVQNVVINQTPDATWISNNMGVNQIQFSLFSPTNGASYLWNFGDGTSSNQATPLKNYNQAGTYYVCVSVSKNGCTSTQCDSVTAKDIFSFSGPDAEAMNLNVYPNPFSENVMVGMQLTETAQVVASLRDVTGKLIATFDLGQRSMGNHQVELETAPLSLSMGTYMLTLDINGKLFTSRVVRGH